MTVETPTNDQFPEAPQTKSSRVLSKIGWILVLLWVVGVAGYAAWEVWVRPTLGTDSIDEPLGRKVVIFSGIFGFVMLFGSVLLDRLKTFKTDRYKEVRK